MEEKNTPPYAGGELNTPDQSCASRCPIAVEDSTVYLLRFVHTSETTLGSYEEEKLFPGQEVVAPSRYGRDLARVLGAVDPNRAADLGAVLPITRIASEGDTARYRESESFEARALTDCRARVESHDLKMKILSTHFLPEENKLLFFFTADGRVDFRELVRDLVGTFRMRIELRQIGVRDETRLLGGVGVCGRVLCCHSYPNQMCSVSIKMAKEQNLSLGSMKVSGPCGRLMCCLSYEYDYYAAERTKFPKQGTVVQGPGMRYLVVDVNMVSRKVALSGEEGGAITVDLSQFSYEPARRSWKVALSPPTAAQVDIEQPE